MHLHDDDGRDVIPPIPYQSPQNFTPPLYYPPLKPKSKKGRNILIAVAAFVVLIVIAAIASAPKNTDPPSKTAGTASTSSAEPTPVTNASDALAVGAPTTAAAAPVKQQVTYACTGHAPDGVDITYGPDGSNLSATRLPFTKTADLDTAAIYYVTTAQLQGGGSVSCTTTVTYDDDSGTAQTITKTASASGGYNIASAEICTSFGASYVPC